MAYTPSQRELLFKRVIKGLQSGTSLRQVLKNDGMPSRTALYDWLDKDVKFQERFARAMEMGDEVLEERKLEIASLRLIETVEESGYSGEAAFSKTTTRDNVQRSKLMIETINTILARRNPRKYGNKIDVTSAGEALAVPAIIGMTIKNEITPTDGPTSPSFDEDDDLN